MVLVGSFVACSSSVAPSDSGVDAGSSTDAATDSTPVDSATIDTGTIEGGVGDAGRCGVTGTYDLETYFCGTVDITASWKAVIPTETITITDAVTGGCRADFKYSSSTCSETEAVEFSAALGQVTASYKGIDSCMPTSCTFAPGDAPCVIGDRKGDRAVTITSVQGGLNRLVIETDDPGICRTAGKPRITLVQR